MPSTELEAVASRQALMPIPVVVDACVLLRNVGYTLRKGWNGALLESASGGYTLFSGVVLFATKQVLDEVEEHLPRIARDAHAPIDAALQVWSEVFLPRLRIVELDEGLVSDPRVEAVCALDLDDAPTAALAVVLAPCILLTDNRKHFEPLGLPDQPVDELAVDIHKISELMMGTNGVVLLTGLTGAGIVEGSKKLVAVLGKEGAALIALLLIGAAYLYWRSEPGSRFRKGVAAIARDVGPPLLEAVADRTSLSEKVAALAIQSADDQPSAFREVAQRLATGQSTMTTAEIARRLNESGYRFAKDGNYQTLARAWLVGNPCFFELQRGHWSLGYHALPRGAEAAA
jgi:predicted nucleic acid-binding protein